MPTPSITILPSPKGFFAGERVVLTNYAAEDVRHQCLSLGASKVFDKSGEIDALIDYCLQLARHQPAPPSGPDGSAVEAG